MYILEDRCGCHVLCSLVLFFYMINNKQAMTIVWISSNPREKKKMREWYRIYKETLGIKKTTFVSQENARKCLSLIFSFENKLKKWSLIPFLVFSYYTNTSIDPLSSVRDSKVGNGTGLSPPIFPINGRLGILGHQSPTTWPLSRLNAVPWAGHVTHPLEISAWNIAVLPTRGSPRWEHLLLTARTLSPSIAKRIRWPFTSTTSFPFACFKSDTVLTLVQLLACTQKFVIQEKNCSYRDTSRLGIHGKQTLKQDENTNLMQEIEGLS